MEADVANDPVDVGGLGPGRVVPDAKRATNLIEKPRRPIGQSHTPRDREDRMLAHAAISPISLTLQSRDIAICGRDGRFHQRSRGLIDESPECRAKAWLTLRLR